MWRNIREPREVTAGEFACYIYCVEALGERPTVQDFEGYSADELRQITDMLGRMTLKEALRLTLLARKDKPDDL